MPKDDFSGQNLDDVNLSGANMRESDLSKASLRRAQMKGARLQDANLAESDLHGADLDHVDVTGADLRHADLTGPTYMALISSRQPPRKASGLPVPPASLTSCHTCQEIGRSNSALARRLTIWRISIEASSVPPDRCSTGAMSDATHRPLRTDARPWSTSAS